MADNNSLEGVLKKILGAISKSGGLTQEDVRAAWGSVVGEKAAARSAVRALKSGRLIVNMDDSSWLYELTVRKKEIIKKLGEVLKSGRIKDITFRIGDLK